MQVIRRLKKLQQPLTIAAVAAAAQNSEVKKEITGVSGREICRFMRSILPISDSEEINNFTETDLHVDFLIFSLLICSLEKTGIFNRNL